MSLPKVPESPWMTSYDRAQIGVRIRGQSVLEWGSGGSTRLFAPLARSWTSFEHDPAWAKAVRALLIPRTEVYWIELGEHYADAPLHMGRRWDVAIIDGRLRRRCLLTAAKVADVVLLHDAERTYYHCAFSVFAYGRFLSKDLWEGLTPSDDLIMCR
jgi:hypothetical protein